MNNNAPLYPWGHERRFNAYSNYFKKYFGHRIQKLSIDAGFSCPNRDGTLSRGGCTFCNNDAFNPSYCQPHKSITQQLNEGIEFHEWRYKKSGEYLAYFQAYSNTYGSLDTIKKLYEEALAHPKVIGLVIGTRPDCVDEQKLDYLQQLSQHHYITVEYGIESCYDKTLKRISRGHNFKTTQKAFFETAQRGIKTGGHLIFGLPGESKDEMLAQAQILSQMPIHTLKFHQLQILKGSLMEIDFQHNPQNYRFFAIDEYIDFVIDFLEHIRPDIVIERFAGEVPPQFQAGPNWGFIRNEQIPVKVEKRMQERDTWQGKKYIEK